MARVPIETLVPELIHEEEWRRMRATAACVRGGPRAVQALIGALETGPPELKREAAAMLARLKDPSAGLALIRLLDDKDEAVCEAGARALEQMAGVLDAQTVSELVALLSNSREDTPHRRRLMQVIGALPTAVTPLCELLRDPDPDRQVAAATILHHLLDPRSIDALIDAMGQPAVQSLVVETLKKLSAIRTRIDEAFTALRNIEGAGEREEARMATVIDLLAIGRPAVEILIEYLEDEDWVVREAAADLLGKIGDIRAVEPLMKRLNVDTDTGVKELAIKSLGLIGDARPIHLYLEALPIRPLRVSAMEALAKIKDVHALQPYRDLFEQLRGDRDGLVAYNAGLVADKLAALAEQQRREQEEESRDDE